MAIAANSGTEQWYRHRGIGHLSYGQTCDSELVAAEWVFGFRKTAQREQSLIIEGWWFSAPQTPPVNTFRLSANVVMVAPFRSTLFAPTPKKFGPIDV